MFQPNTYRFYLKNTLHFFKKHPIGGTVILFVCLFLTLNFIFPIHTQKPFSTIITAADNTPIHAFLSSDEKWRMYAETSEITPTLRKAFLQKEDKYFYWHWGVNPVAIMRAFMNNLISGKRTSGASTITMQVVRLLYPNERTYFTKLIEMIRAIQLETFYSKEEILQLYLNLVPYGSNIEGIKAASMLYFQKLPDRLSLAEVTTLAIIPNRPTSLQLGTRNPLIIEERNKWLRRFQREKVFDNQVINDALKEPLKAIRHQAPKEAPQLSIRLKNLFPTEPIVHSTLNRTIQTKVEQLTFSYVNRLKAKNIQNAAVLIINNQTMTVEAYVGSADFENTSDGGQVDGVLAIRSPGSALKPLLYATAFDKGILTPKTIINDVPTNFNGFEPENFDKRFNGAISAEFALANSLNIPAVKILRDLGKNELIEKLKIADFRTVKQQEKGLGLSIVLGGCGVTLEEMTRLYAAFANEGKLKQFSFVKQSESNKNGHQSTEFLSPNATFLTTEILSQIKRPDLPNNFDYTYHLPKIAWKTGTSFGKRDAWSIGYNKKYTVGVWVGNFSGVGVPELSGAEIATPLLFQIFNTIDYNSSAGWYRQPENVVLRQVCAESGNLPSEYCINKVLDQSIKGVSHTRKCTHLKKVFVNHSESISYCNHCLPLNGDYKEKVYQNLAPELLAFYESKKVSYDKIPPHNSSCTRIFKSTQLNVPLIVSPNNGSEFLIDKTDVQQIQLACQASNDIKEVFWYINDQFLRKTPANMPIFFTPTGGKIKVSCVDDKGRRSDSWISVKIE